MSAMSLVTMMSESENGGGGSGSSGSSSSSGKGSGAGVQYPYECSSSSELRPGAHIHLMGICGTAMASLAGLLKGRGYKITGSDANPYPPMSDQIEALGISLLRGYKKENLHPQPDFVIVGNVIASTNEEAQELLRLQIPYTSLPKAMGEWIIENRECIVVAGTHGKTTTSSLMAWLATQEGLKPGFLIGGIPKNFSHSFQNPEGSWFIIEGDEYDTAFFDKVPKFVHYKPKHVILTSVEFDHADIYKDLDHVKKAFSLLMKMIPQEGVFLYWAGHPNVLELAQQVTHCDRIFSYDLKKENNQKAVDYESEVIEMNEEATRFRLFFRGSLVGDFSFHLSGDYNVLNATATLGMAHQLSWNMERMTQALDTFKGVKRRQEILGEPGGVLVIEDFAHHPTAVSETLKGIRRKYPLRKIFAVFEPRSATSRRKIFQREYVKAFEVADEVILARAFDQSKIDEDQRFSSEDLVKDLGILGKSAVCWSNADEIVKDLIERVRPKDLVIIMSNGGFDGIYKKLLSQLDLTQMERS